MKFVLGEVKLKKVQKPKELDPVSQYLENIKKHPDDYKKALDRVKTLVEANIILELEKSQVETPKEKKLKFKENAEVINFQQYKKNPISEDINNTEAYKKARIQAEKEKIEIYNKLQKRHTKDDLELLNRNQNKQQKKFDYQDDLDIPSSQNYNKFDEVEPSVVRILPKKEVAIRDNAGYKKSASLSAGFQAMKLLTKEFLDSNEGKEFVSLTKEKYSEKNTQLISHSSSKKSSHSI